MDRLKAIAQAMKTQAADTGMAQRRLPKGLILTLRRDGLDWVLSLTRFEVRASDSEIAICRWAFEVPEDAESEVEEINEYQVRRVRWVAASQGALFEWPEPPGGF